MEHPFLVAGIVFVSFIALAQPTMKRSFGHGQSYKGHGYRHGPRYRPCYPTAVLGDECDVDKRCAWNRSECPGYPGCHLICTNNPYKLCYGLDLSDVCNGNERFQCWPDHTGQLTCVDIEGICTVGR